MLKIFLPGHPGYSAECAAFNTAILHKPDMIVGAASTQNVVAAILLAKQKKLQVHVQATGHGAVEPIVGGMLICTHRMNQVAIDPERRTATIAAGVRWQAVWQAAAPYGLTAIGGAAADVGVVGYLLGGGLGPLARSHGFSSDYVESFTVVTETGQVVEASLLKNADLFWALRGGKVGFGIVTEVKLRLIEMQSLYAGALLFEEPHIETVLRAWCDWTKHSDPLVTTSIAIVRLPEKRVFMLRFAYPGAVAEGVRLAAPLRQIAPILHDRLSELPADQLGAIHNDPSTPMAFWSTSALLMNLDQVAVGHIIEASASFGAVEVRHIGSATQVDVKAGSAVGGREAGFTLSLIGRNPQQHAENYALAADRLFTQLTPWLCLECNINFLGNALSKPHFAALWPEQIRNKLAKYRNLIVS